MPVTVRIPSPLRTYTDGADTLDLDGGTVGDLLSSLTGRAPGIENRLFKGEGEGRKLNRFVNIYVNDEDIRFLDGLGTLVKAGDEVSIVPAIAGG